MNREQRTGSREGHQGMRNARRPFPGHGADTCVQHEYASGSAATRLVEAKWQGHSVMTFGARAHTCLLPHIPLIPHQCTSSTLPQPSPPPQQMPLPTLPPSPPSPPHIPLQIPH